VPGRPEVSVIVPTFNERSALEALHPRLVEALRPYTAEILIVDDRSPDGTGAFVRSLSPPGLYRLIERERRDGLAMAVVEGINAARGDVVVVMDGDGSHPPETLASLIDPIREGRAEFVLASRRLPGGSAPGLTVRRRIISTGASLLAWPLVRVSDPMSGFFAMSANVAARADLRPAGFKIALEVLVKCRPRPIGEVPFRFAPRIAGESKLGTNEIVHYVVHLAELLRWRTVQLIGRHRPSLPTVVPLATTTAVWAAGLPGPHGVEDRREAADEEARGARFAYDQILAHEVEAEPGDGSGDADGGETARQQREGAFAAAAPGP